MPSEIEAKMKVNDLEVIRGRLRSENARRVGSEMETNTFLDTPDGSLVGAGRGLRVREARDLESGRVRHVITYKGPQQKGNLKNREEIEFSADDGAAAVALLRAIGFDVVLSFEKRRETWELGDCEVVLDELPVLGTFVEIEGPGEESVMRVREQLGLSASPLIPTGYATMLATHLESINDDRRVVTF